jgi:hypothetical protein
MPRRGASASAALYAPAVRLMRNVINSVARILRRSPLADPGSPCVVTSSQRGHELRSVLLQAAEAAATYLDTPVWEPSPGSEGTAEVANQESGPAGPWGEIPVRTAHALTHALMDTVLTHVRALALLYVDSPPAMAPTTVARSVMEAGATAWWIMEPGIGPRCRVARVTSERLRSAREAAKAISQLPESVDPADYSETEQQVRDYATALGLAAMQGDPRIDGQVRPNSTDLISSLFETDTALNRNQARMVYPVYSGVAHALLYGVMQFLRPTVINGEARLIWNTDPHIIDAVVSYTLAVVIAAMDRVLAVMGWDAASWNTWKSTLPQYFAAP